MHQPRNQQSYAYNRAKPSKLRRLYLIELINSSLLFLLFLIITYAALVVFGGPF